MGEAGPVLAMTALMIVNTQNIEEVSDRTIVLGFLRSLGIRGLLSAFRGGVRLLLRRLLLIGGLAPLGHGGRSLGLTNGYSLRGLAARACRLDRLDQDRLAHAGNTAQPQLPGQFLEFGQLHGMNILACCHCCNAFPSLCLIRLGK